MLGDRVCVKVSDTEDAFGEPITKLSFYCDTARVVRFLNGRGLNIPYGGSPERVENHRRRLIAKRRRVCAIVVDDGALHAVFKRMSFFPVGVKRVDGEFCRGDVVAITSLQDLVIGAGVSNFSSKDLRRVMGMRSSEIASKIEIAPNRSWITTSLLPASALPAFRNYLEAMLIAAERQCRTLSTRDCSPHSPN